MADKPQINPRIEEDGSVLFDTEDGITVRVVSESPKQVRVEMWRDSDNKIVPPDVGNLGIKSFRESLAKSAREVFNLEGGKSKETIAHIDEDLGQIATLMGIPAMAELLKPEEGTKLVDRLVDCVEAAGELFLTPEGEPHVALEIEGHIETHEIRGSRFRQWLRGHFYATEQARLEAKAEADYERLLEQLGGMAPDSFITVRRPDVVRDQTLGDAIAQLEAKAYYEKNVRKVFLRVGQYEDKIYIDLGNDLWDAVEIDPDGWRIAERPPVSFIRPKGIKELPYPEAGGSVGLLKEVLTLGEDDGDRQAWALIVSFLVASLRPQAPEFPILVLLGGQGTAKSTTSRMLRALIDPNVVADTGEPRSKDELHIDADCSWLMAYDNLSGLSPWLSDALCRISTGSAFTKRTLYTARDREIFKAAQPQILNGIADVVTRGDIIDRGLLVNLPVITEYREGDAVWRDFERVRPQILGALYSAVSAGLRSIAEGEEIMARLPRMAGFAKWSIRCERALGLAPGEFLKAFGGSREEGAATVLEAEPISYHVYEYGRQFGPAEPWEGTAKQLLDTLNFREEDEAIKRSREWPKAPNILSRLLGRIAPALAKQGIIWRRTSESNRKGKIYQLFYVPPASGGEPEPGPGGGDDTPQGGDDTEKNTVPTENSMDKPIQEEGTIGDDGDDTFLFPEEDGIDYYERAAAKLGMTVEQYKKLLDEELADMRDDESEEGEV